MGMAIASRWLGTRYNRPGKTLFDFDVYAILGDGCMMEGISSEAASLAGHLKLGNLCWIYDNNHISLDGKTALSFSEDAAARFGSHGLGGDPRRRRQRPRQARPGLSPSSRACRTGRRCSSSTATSATAPRRSRTPAPPTASRWARRRCAPPSATTAGRRMRNSSSRTACARISPRGSARGAGRARAPGRRRSTTTGREHPDLADEVDRMRRHDLPADWQAALTSLPGRCQGSGHPRIVGQGAGGAGGEDPLDCRRCRGPERLHPDLLQGRGPDGAGASGGAQRLLRRARARDGSGRQRDGGERAARLRRDLLHLHRLHANADPSLRADGDPVAVGDDPRLDRSRRGRADAPAHRATRRAPRRAPAARLPAGGCQRGGGELARRPAARPPSLADRAQPAGAAHLGPQPVRRRRRHRPRGLRPRRGRGWEARGAPARHRQRGDDGDGGARPSWRRPASARGW